MKILGKDYTIDARLLMTMSTADRTAMMKNSTFREEILRALTPVQLAQLFPQEFRRGAFTSSGGGGGGGGGGGAGALASGLSGVPSAATEASSAPGTPTPSPASTQPMENSGWFQRFMKKYDNAAATNMPTTTGALPSAPKISGAGNPLSSQRIKASSQLNQDLKLHMYALTMAEVGRDNPAAQRALMETIYNRYTAQKKASLSSTMQANYYEPLRQGTKGWANYNRAKQDLMNNPELFKQMDQRHNEVVAGSNDSNYSTQNGSAHVAASARQTQTIGAELGGETFSRKDNPAYAKLHGAGTVKNEGDWYKTTMSEMQAYQAGKMLAVSPEATKPTTVASTSNVGSKGTLLFLHGMQSRYGNKSPAQVEAEARRYAAAKGLNFEAINVSGDMSQKQREAAIARINQGGITHVFGFSAGGHNIKHIVNGLNEDTKKQIQGVTIVGSNGEGKVGNIPTEIYGNPKTGHMDAVNYVASKAEMEKEAGKQSTGVSDIFPQTDAQGKPTLGPSGSAGGPKKDMSSVPGFTEITPEKQTARPGHYYGMLDIDGLKIPFGTGGATDKRTGKFFPSAPAGSSEIGALNPHNVPGGVGYEVPGLNVKDPRAGWHRSGIVIHTNSSQSEMQRLYSHGCISIAKKDWPTFQKAISAFKQKYGSAYINLDPYGNVYSVTAKPVYDAGGKLIEAQTVQQTIQSKQQTGELAPKFAFPNGLSTEVMEEVMKKTPEEQARFIKALNGDPERVQAANQMFVESKNAQTAIQAIKNAPPGELPKEIQVQQDLQASSQPGAVKKPVAPVTGTAAGGGGSVYGAGRKSKHGGHRAHSGIDMQAENGSSVVEMVGGTVLSTGNDPGGYDHWIAVKGDDGIIRRYAAHGSVIPAKPGTRVEQGQRIGTIGRGHLHYEEVPPGSKIYDSFLKDGNAATSNQTGTRDPLTGLGISAGHKMTAGQSFFKEDRAPVTATQISQMSPEPSPIGPAQSAGGPAGKTITSPTATPVQDQATMFNINADPLEGVDRGRVPLNAFDSLNAEEKQALRVQFATDPSKAQTFVDEYNKRTTFNVPLIGKQQITATPERIAEGIRSSESYKTHFSQPADVRQQIISGSVEKLNQQMQQAAQQQQPSTSTPQSMPQESTNTPEMATGGETHVQDSVRVSGRITPQEAATPGAVKMDGSRMIVNRPEVADQKVRVGDLEARRDNKQAQGTPDKAPDAVNTLENKGSMTVGNVPQKTYSYASHENFGDNKQSASQENAFSAARFHQRPFQGLGTRPSNTVS